MITVAHEAEINQLVHTILRGFVFHIGWLIPIFLAITLAIGILAIRSRLRPLREVSHMASAIGPNETAIRLPESNLPSEMVPLVAAVNHALGRLEQGFAVQREFTANAAHQLRTPLAIITGALDSVEGNGAIKKLRSDLVLLSDLDVRPVAAWSADFPIGRIAFGVWSEPVSRWIGPKSGSAQRSFMTLRMRANSLSA